MQVQNFPRMARKNIQKIKQIKLEKLANIYWKKWYFIYYNMFVWYDNNEGVSE